MLADCFDPSVINGASPFQEAISLKQFVENEGSPLQFGIAQDKMEEFFMQRGFETVTVMNATACKEKYFTGGRQNRSISSIFNFIHAMVQNS